MLPISSVVRAGLIAMAVGFASDVANAAPSGASGGVGSASAEVPTRCERSFVFSPVKRRCVSVKTGRLSDTELYEQGRALALAGHYGNALDALLAIKDQNDSMVLTMIGFAKRKSGRVEEGMAFYARALAIDPNNPDTHEYLGEGHVAAGRLDLAMAALHQIERICGNRDCEQYLDLAAAIAGEPEAGWGE